MPASPTEANVPSLVVLDPHDVLRLAAPRLWALLERANASEPPVDAVEAAIQSCLVESGGRLEGKDLSFVRSRLRVEIMGLGPLDRFLTDPEVSEVMVASSGAIYVERSGSLENTGEKFLTHEGLRAAISRLASTAGRRVDLSNPLCDLRLPDGSRANIVLPPISIDGPLLTIRRFRSAYQTLDDLIRAGMMDAASADSLRKAVVDRRNILVAGNSGAGKTTLLNALSACIADEERIITLEDAAELRIRKPHVIRLETRPANSEGKGEVTMRDLVINALRMRPDRLIVGECRGTEAIPMLQAMNTGHDGSLTTLHANSAADVVERLESMVLIGAPQWPPSVVRRQVRSAIHVVAYLKRERGLRRLVSVGPLEISGHD